MGLDFQITAGKFGSTIQSDGIECHLDQPTHTKLSSEVQLANGSYPILNRFQDFGADVYVEPTEIKPLISEIENATLHFPFGSEVKTFFGPFHTLCCLAWSRGGGISAYCD